MSEVDETEGAADAPVPVDRGARQPDDGPAFAVRAALAALTAAAGVVHLVMVPGHSQDSTLDGVLFLLVGWAQVGLAVLLLTWARRSVLAASVVVNLAAAVAWVVSRTAGLPFGGHAGDKEVAGTLDQMTTAFEVAAVLLAAAILLRPGLWRSLGDGIVALGVAVPVAVVVATSVVLTAPETANHHHEDTADAAAPVSLVSADNRCDLGFNPAAYWRDATVAGFDTVAGTTSLASATDPAAAAAPAAGGHSHGAAPAADTAAPATPALPSIDRGRGSEELDRVMALSQAPGEIAEAQLVMALAEVSDESYDQWLERVSTTPTHAGPQTWAAMTDADDCADLTAELEVARETALAHPTVTEAEAAGYVRVTPYVQGIAAHYMNFDYVDQKFEIDKPEMLLYDGTLPDSNIVGLSYYISMGAEVEPSQGFVGDNDRYHVHVGLCVGAGGVIGDSQTTEEECEERGGRKSGGSGNWMSHAWVVPGCESPWGVFSGANPILDTTLGEQTTKDGGSCAGSGVLDRYDLEPGTATNTPTPVSTGELASP